MAEYDSIIAVAKRLIAKKGRAVKLLPLDSGSLIDPDKPWYGANDDGQLDAVAAFVSDERSEDNGQQQRRAEAYIAADPSYDISNSWQVIDTLTTWNVTLSELIAPGLQQVVWRLELAAMRT